MEVLQRTANRGSISTGPYEVDNSVKLETANNEWFYNASPTAGNRRTYTFSFWIKRTALGTVNASGNQYVIGQGQHGRMFFGSDYFQYRFDDGHDCRNVSRQFRDTSAWYHFVVAVDTNQSSAANRVKLYVNGESLAVDDHDGGSFPDIQDQGAFFSTSYLTLGTAPFGGSFNVGDGDYDISCYLAEFCAVDGQQLAPTDFGEYDEDSGIWIPIDVSGINFGSQGFYLNFATAGDLGDDKSGNGKDLTENNLAAADQATDTCTNNFATINLLFKYPSSQVISEGATKVARSSGSGLNKTFISTIAVTAGKWYAEFKPTAGGSNYAVGIMPIDTASSVDMDANHLGNSSYTASLGYYSPDGSMLAAGNAANGSFGASYTANDIIGVALDMDNRKVYFSKNGTYQNSQDPTNGTNAITLTDTSDGYHIGFTYDTSGTVECNFGGYHANTLSSAAADGNGFGSFENAPPTGYLALCTKNLGSDGG